ncbi:MAG: ABC transporter permease [Clostridia bacterium]|nr:ABC transporter permease [Clostridia bacterium]MDD4387318.1 ABC transporter permease [Clostridia bacterium]
MKAINFAKRNIKELIRDPLSIIFAIILPLFLLVIFQQFKIPSDVYKIENFTPGIIIFSFSFITLFTATLVANDRNSSLLTRLFSSPMKPMDYIFGYTLAVLPIVILQSILFYTVALFFGLSFSVNIILSIIVAIPISILFIALGIIIGTITTAKASSGVGSIIVQLVAFTSGMYFSSDMIGKTFNSICKILPFSRVLDLVKGVLNSDYTNVISNVIISTTYIIMVTIIAIILFKNKMNSDNK